MSKVITAIDIGSHKVCAVIAVVEDNGKVKVVGEASHPSYGIKKGEIIGIEEAISSIASALTGAERMSGLTVSSAYVSINGKNIVSNNNKGVVAVNDSEIMDEDIIRALDQARTVAIPQSREIVHLIPREFIVDQQSGIKNPIGMTGSRLEVDAHIISAPVTSIHNIERCIQSVGLRIDSAVFTGWASAQAVLTPTEKELGVLLLDIGGGTTTITAFVEDCVSLSTSVPLGGTHVTKDLAAGLRMSLDDAERVKVNATELLKKTVNSSSKKSTDREVTEEDDKDKKGGDIIDISEYNIENLKTMSKKFFTMIVEERVKEIFEIVRDAVENSGHQYQLPAGIVLTGGSAGLPGVTAIAKKIFGVPARVASPRGLEGLIDGISTPDYATVQGMILYGKEDEGVYSAKTNRFSDGSGSKKGNKGGGLLGGVRKFFKDLMP